MTVDETAHLSNRAITEPNISNVITISFHLFMLPKKTLLSFLIGWIRAFSMIFNHETNNQLALLV